MKTSYIYIKIDKNLKERVQARTKAESTTLTAVITQGLVKYAKNA